MNPEDYMECSGERRIEALHISKMSAKYLAERSRVTETYCHL